MLIQCSILIKYLLLILIFFCMQACAWPPGAHDAIGNEASLPQVLILEDNPPNLKFRCGNVLADISHVLEFPPFSISDAEEVMHSHLFSKTMFEIARNSNNKDQMAWSAGWQSHDTADGAWAVHYIKGCNITQKSLKEWIFEYTNEVAIKYIKKHDLISKWVWYPELVSEAYEQITGKVLPVWKVNLASRFWASCVSFWYSRLPEYFLHSGGEIWKTTRENWEKYFRISVEEVEEDINNLYGEYE
jgi:hypothetical protein